MLIFLLKSLMFAEQNEEQNSVGKKVQQKGSRYSKKKRQIILINGKNN